MSDRIQALVDSFEPKPHAERESFIPWPFPQNLAELVGYPRPDKAVVEVGTCLCHHGIHVQRISEEPTLLPGVWHAITTRVP